MRCDPADKIIKAFGGLSAVARICGTKVNTVIRWRMPKGKSGTGGVIPHWHIPKLLADPKAKELGLTPADFFPVMLEDDAQADKAA